MSHFEKAGILGATGPTGIHLASVLRDRIPAVRVVSRSEKNLERLFPDATLERVTMVPHYAKPIAYDASKLHRLIGETHRTSYADGIAQTLGALRQT